MKVMDIAKRKRKYIRKKPVSASKLPHKSLSVRALKKRLYRAGISSVRAKEIAHEIKHGPRDFGIVLQGVLVLGWPINELIRRYGKRVTRAIIQFVERKYVLLDEAWMVLKSSDAEGFISKSYRMSRKYSPHLPA